MNLIKLPVSVMKKTILLFSGLVCLMFSCGSQESARQTASISVFAGSAVQLPLKEIAEKFRQQEGVQVDLLFGSSGFMLSQMRLTSMGDVYMPGSMDFMLKAKQENLVDPGSISTVAYLIPAINVKSGNPKKIFSLADLSRPGIRVGIARPEHVCVGLYAVELLEANGLLKSVLPNIVVTTESCAKTASAIALSDLDAVIGWRVFQYWSPERIESVLIKDKETVPRIGVIPIALTSMAKDITLAKKFIDFTCGGDARALFRKWGYITDESRVRQLAPNACIGGEFQLPADWMEGKTI